VNYTDKGSRRALSEARRAWNYVCEVEGCGQRFNRPCRLESHMRSHNKERPFACPNEGCHKSFPRKDHLQRHLKNSHEEPVRNFACDWEGCDKAFTSNGRLQRHRDIHESKFYCSGHPPCKEAFRKQKTLDAHIQTAHLEAKAYPCTYVDAESGERCAHGYQTEASLRRHMEKVHENETKELHFCMSCIPPGTEFEIVQNAQGQLLNVPKNPLSFTTIAELQEHDREYHAPVCEICGKGFKDRQGLKAHLQTVHTDPADQKQYLCPHCNKTFNKKSNCKAHIEQVHEKLDKFVCSSDAMHGSKHQDLMAWSGENACEKRFRTKSSLEQHIRTHHLGLKNRKDTRKLVKRQKLLPEPTTLSLLTGAGWEDSRPVPCLFQDCQRRFIMDRDLKRHLKAEHEFTDADVQAALLERNATNGGPFWIGGLNDQESMSMFESVEPSMPQTPMPYFTEQGMQTGGGILPKMKETPFDSLGPSLMDLSIFHAENADMALPDLQPIGSMLEDSLWDGPAM